MKNYYVYANHIISIDLPETIPLLHLKQHLPGIEKSIIEKADISITFKDSLDPQLRFDLQSLKIYDFYNSSWLLDLPHLIYSYLKYVFFHKNIYFVHSCMIQNTLLIGHSGSGKTSLCIQALEQKLSINSCDRTCVTFEHKADELNNELVTLHVISGTDVLSVRQEEKQPNLPMTNSSADRNIYGITMSDSHTIEKIKLFHISPNKKEKSIEGLSKVHQLYSFFIDNIKSDCFVQNGKFIFSPVYSEKHKKILFENLKNIRIPVSFVSGTIENILQNIETKL